MMKKTVSSILLASALLLGTVAPVAANAAEVSGTTGNTKTQAAFTAPKSVTTPVDPNNPDTPSTGENEGNGATSTDGGLTFLYVTDSIDFGSAQAVSSGSQSLDVNKISTGSFTADKQVNPNFVTELSDTRGTSAGWHVTVSSSPMTDSNNENTATNTLKGATVDFGGSTTIKNSASTDGISANTVSVPTDGKTAQTIYQAAENNGAGQTAFQLDPTNIKLSNVGANTNTGTYSGNLTWTLDDAPVEPAK